MSDDETSELNRNKRRLESDDDGDEEEVTYKREKLSDPTEVDSEVNHSRRSIDEAIKALDRIQNELNMSPEPSDHDDTPPESEDETTSEDMLNQAHALGFAACMRETFRFLDVMGIPENDPIYKQLKSRFVETSN